jgi:hypothetical protein
VKKNGRGNRSAWLFGIAIAVIAGQCSAYTECLGHITREYAGDGGYVWVQMDDGLTWYVAPGDPDLQNILATATSALVTGLSITVRFSTDSVPCNGSNGNRSDVQGMWLQNN